MEPRDCDLRFGERDVDEMADHYKFVEQSPTSWKFESSCRPNQAFDQVGNGGWSAKLWCDASCKSSLFAPTSTAPQVLMSSIRQQQNDSVFQTRYRHHLRRRPERGRVHHEMGGLSHLHKGHIVDPQVSASKTLVAVVSSADRTKGANGRRPGA
jgi:hypothetical protein